MSFNSEAFASSIGRMTDEETKRACIMLVREMGIELVIEALTIALDPDDHEELAVAFETVTEAANG